MSALILLPVALYCVWEGGWWFAGLTGVCTAGLAFEWAALCGWSIRSRSAAAPRAPIALVLGVPYFAPAMIALPWLRADPVAGRANTLFMLVVIWGSDIGAYAIGRLIGGPRLAPLISPGKTWSGAVGGLAAAVLAGFAVAACVPAEFSPSHVIVLAAGLGVLAQTGDLMESALKRHFGVKDSGWLIPGHGGLLDRVDAVLAVAPAAAAVAYFVGRGDVLWR